MKLPLKVAKQLILLQRGEILPASQCMGKIYSQMLEDGVLQKLMLGRQKSVIALSKPDFLSRYLHNQFGITDLTVYAETLSAENITRADAVVSSGNSKLRAVNTFSGFMVNSFSPVEAKLNGELITIYPTPGSCIFIHDCSSFSIGENITVVGVENGENFFQIHKQQHHFTNIEPLFVSRYPQNGSLLRWLKNIPNKYLHFGDFDFEGLAIFEREFEQYLGSRSHFFIPEGLETFIRKYGNRELYLRQSHSLPKLASPWHELIPVFHKYKKVLEQEALINNTQ